MTSFLPPLSTATAPQNEIICPELRISGAYLPRTQNFRGWPAQKIPAAELIPPQKSPKNCRGEWSDFVRGNRAKPHPYFSYTFRPLLYPLPGSNLKLGTVEAVGAGVGGSGSGGGCMRAFLGVGVVVGLAGAAYWYLTREQGQAKGMGCLESKPDAAAAQVRQSAGARGVRGRACAAGRSQAPCPPVRVCPRRSPRPKRRASKPRRQRRPTAQRSRRP